MASQINRVGRVIYNATSDEQDDLEMWQVFLCRCGQALYQPVQRWHDRPQVLKYLAPTGDDGALECASLSLISTSVPTTQICPFFLTTYCVSWGYMLNIQCQVCIHQQHVHVLLCVCAHLRSLMRATISQFYMLTSCGSFLCREKSLF